MAQPTDNIPSNSMSASAPGAPGGAPAGAPGATHAGPPRIPHPDLSRGAVVFMYAICVLCTAFGNLSQTAVNSMLVAIDMDFGIAASTGQWLTTIYMLCLGITVPVTTFLSRRLCIRHMLFVALAMMIVGSIMDIFALSFPMLVVGRVLQAASAGVTMPLLNSIVMIYFPHSQQGTAMGIGGIALGFAPNLGPMVGGGMSDVWGWRSFFIVLAIGGVLLLACTLFGVKKQDAPDRNASMDWLSLLLSTVGFGGFLLGVSNASSYGFANPLVWIPMVVGIAGVIAFVLRQNKSEKPLISMEIFKARDYVTAFVVQVTLMCSFLGISLILPLFVQQVMGYSASVAGLVFLPCTVVALIFNPLGGICTDKFGMRPVALIGGGGMLAGALIAVFMTPDSPLWVPMLSQALRGLGMSALIGPTIAYGLRQVPGRYTVDGSSFMVLVRQAAASLGTAAMVLLVSLIGGPAGFCAAFVFSTAVGVVMYAFIVFRMK